MGRLQLAQDPKRFRAGFHGIHQEKHVLRVLLVLDALAEGKDGHCEFIGKTPVAGFIMVFAAGAGVAMFVMGRGNRDSLFRARGRSSRLFRTDDTEGLSLDFEERASACFTGLFEHFTPFEEVFSHYFIIFAHWHVFTVGLIFNLYMPVTHINYRYTGRCSHAKP